MVVDFNIKNFLDGFFYVLDSRIAKLFSAIMDQYDPKNKIDLIVDEWGG